VDLAEVIAAIHTTDDLAVDAGIFVRDDDRDPGKNAAALIGDLATDRARPLLGEQRRRAQP
jgi:hypothetical protein